MSTLWIAIDTDYNKEDSEYGKVFVMVDNVICVPRFYRFFLWLMMACRSSSVVGFQCEQKRDDALDGVQ